MKIACLEGSIRYLMDKEFGYIKPEIKMAAPRMVYKIYEDGEDQPVLDRENSRLLRKFISARRVHLIVQDVYGQQKNNVIYNFEVDKESHEALSIESLKKRLCNATYWSEDDIEHRIIVPLNNITLNNNAGIGQAETEHCIFLLPAQDGYGFRIYQVRIVMYSDGKTNYYLVNNRSIDKIDGEYHSFEKMTSFFDGTR